ncbi:MAG TPA: metalloregulator ArsR/SmtB family transcription factor [Acidimicrobiales bacterium]|nr:metalloregulator ArsR/SmtB family transcription factor [Acidimicrobiales bacterium]
MQISDTEQAGPGQVTVIGPSLALDLSWAAFGATHTDLREKHAVLARVYGDDPTLERRVQGLWDDGLSCFPEFEVLVARSGALGAKDFGEVRRAVEALLPTVLDTPLALPSETEEDRLVIIRRLEQLQRSKARREKYFAVFADLWRPIDGWWQEDGAPLAARAAEQLQRELDRGTPWHRVTTSCCSVFVEHLPAIIERWAAGHPVALVTCALFGKGMYLDVPEAILVGVGADRAAAGARERTEDLARRLRILSDPTRLAIVDHLNERPASVGELADAFGLAQPTVSAHVKQLREAGLVSAQRVGMRLELAVERDTLNELAGELTSLVSS